MSIINIACGPTGLVWGVTWDGHAIVRTHVCRDSVYGTSLLLSVLLDVTGHGDVCVEFASIILFFLLPLSSSSWLGFANEDFMKGVHLPLLFSFVLPL
jgi:hypothetical protein